MGALLAKPVLEKNIISGKGDFLSYSFCSMQGWRIEMEDAHVAILKMPKPFDRCSFFGIFDGHNGKFVSNKCCDGLLREILRTPEFQHMSFDNFGNPTDIANLKFGIRRGFINFDAYLRTTDAVQNGSDNSGSTAICVIVTQRYVVFINCGDSRGILIRNSEFYFGTADHKPMNPEEIKRIKLAGGTVVSERVNGTLAVSRSFGDFMYKKAKNLSPFQQLITVDPTVTVIERDESDQTVVLACDGIWDVISNEELTNYIYSRTLRIPKLCHIAEEIINICFYKGSKDNMSIIIIFLNPTVMVDDVLPIEVSVFDKFIPQIVAEYLQEHPEATFENLIKSLETVGLPNLPPAEIVPKRHLIEQIFHELKHTSDTAANDSLRQKQFQKAFGR